MKYIVISIIGIISGLIYFYATHECVQSHVETQYQQPVTMNTGGGKDGGSSLNIPLGNIKPVQVEVCDKYQKKS